MRGNFSSWIVSPCEGAHHEAARVYHRIREGSNALRTLAGATFPAQFLDAI